MPVFPKFFRHKSIFLSSKFHSISNLSGLTIPQFRAGFKSFSNFRRQPGPLFRLRRKGLFGCGNSGRSKGRKRGRRRERRRR